MKECPRCKSSNLEVVDIIHKCEHIEVLAVVCLDCNFETIDLKYPILEAFKRRY